MALKINVALDRCSAELVALGKAAALMADVHLPKATAASMAQMTRAVRHALEAGEYPYAVSILREIETRLEDEDSPSAILIHAKSTAVRETIARWLRATGVAQ